MSKILKYSFAFIVAAVAIAQTLRAEGDPITKLHAFSEKVAAQRKASSPNQQSRESSLLGQLQSLEGCIQRNEFEKAQMTIANLSSDLMPGNLQAGWLDLSAGLSEEISRRSAEARQKTQTAVDELVQDVHAACLKAKTSADLDAVLVRCAALQARRLSGQDVVGQRLQQKLAGTSKTLDRWARFLDARSAGNALAANAVLREFLTNQSDFPVMSVAEIKSQLSTDEGTPASFQNALELIFKDVKSPDDLDTALERVKKMGGSPVTTGPALRVEQGTIEMLKAAWDKCKQQDYGAAIQLVTVAQRGDNSAEGKPFHQPFKDAILHTALSGKLRSYGAAEWKPDQTLSAYMDTVLQELRRKADYEAIIDLMKLAESFPEYQFNDGSLTPERIGLEKFLTARRFEAAGDYLAALSEYRSVIGTSGKYIPIKEVAAAVAKLKLEHPEAFKYYEGVVLEEIRKLREEVRQIRASQTQLGYGAPPYSSRP